MKILIALLFPISIFSQTNKAITATITTVGIESTTKEIILQPRREKQGEKQKYLYIENRKDISGAVNKFCGSDSIRCLDVDVIKLKEFYKIEIAYIKIEPLKITHDAKPH